MKTTVNIYDSGIIASMRFKRRIRKLINNELNETGYQDAQSIKIIAVGSGKRFNCSYGGYFDFVKIAVNDFETIIKVIHYDVVAYNEVHDDNIPLVTLSSRLKKLCIDTLKYGVGGLVDDLIDNDVVFKLETELINN